MTDEHAIHLLNCMNESRCQNCSPDRVCAWDCIQGAGIEDILIGAVLEQSLDWALFSEQPESQPVHQALWDSFNA